MYYRNLQSVVNHYSYIFPGFHRYVFLLFKQSGNLDDVEECSNRGSFDAAGFVTKSKLDELVAANFYEARNEPL